MLGHIIVKVKKDAILMRFNHHQVVKIIDQQDDDYIIKVNYRDRELLESNHIQYEFIGYSGIIHYLYLLKHNVSILIGILLFVGILYVNSISVQAIEFNAETEDNEQIEAFIKEHYTSVLSIDFLNADLNELNFQLRRDFSHYEWIDVSRDGTVLKVTLLKPSVINKEVVTQEGYGDLIAVKPGFVTSYQIEHGVVTVNKKQYVQKGQVLVSGNLTINRPDWEPFYIRASGEVYAKVHYTPQITVLKEEQVVDYTGKITTNKYLNLFGLDIKFTNNSIDYADYEKEVVRVPLKIFNFELPLSVKKIHYYEKNDIIKIYDEKTAYEKALSLATREVMKNFGEEDVLLETIELNRKEQNDTYSFKFLIVTNENIAIFQRRQMNEQ